MSDLKRKDYEALLEPLQVELACDGALAQAHRQAPGGAVRRPRHRRQGRRDQRDRANTSIHANARSSRCPSRASAKARNGISSATCPTCPPPARSSCSTAAGTTAPVSRRSWASPTTRRSRPSCDRRRRSRSCSSTTASCCSSTGCAATRTSRRSASPSASTIRSSAGSCRRSISKRASTTTTTRGRARPCSRPPTPAHAPWTLVDFNDQKRGRLTLIRDLLDRLPDTQVPEDRRSKFRRWRASRRRNATAWSSRSWSRSKACSTRSAPCLEPLGRASSSRAGRRSRSSTCASRRPLPQPRSQAVERRIVAGGEHFDPAVAAGSARSRAAPAPAPGRGSEARKNTPCTWPLTMKRAALMTCRASPAVPAGRRPWRSPPRCRAR